MTTSIDTHVRSHQLALAEAIRGRKKLYLDLCYWLRLRDVASGKLTDPNWRTLLQKLQRGVADGILLCPIAESTFMELTKQSDATTRAATARMIDELSLGVALLPLDQRVATEIARFMHIGSDTDLHPLSALVWSKVSYVLGVVHPVLAGIDENAERDIQKLFFNQLWHVSLADMVETIGDGSPDDGPVFENLARTLNQQNAIHAEELKSFEGTYKIETQGVASLCAPIMAEVIADMANKAGHPAPSPGSARWNESLKKYEGFLRAVMVKPQAQLALRTMHIKVCFHAHVRWNKKRQFEANDFYDINHAAAALGYCDAFFTERSLADFARRSNTRLTDINGCRVTHRIEEAIQIAGELAVPLEPAA